MAVKVPDPPTHIDTPVLAGAPENASILKALGLDVQLFELVVVS